MTRNKYCFLWLIGGEKVYLHELELKRLKCNVFPVHDCKQIFDEQELDMELLVKLITELNDITIIIFITIIIINFLCKT